MAGDTTSEKPEDTKWTASSRDGCVSSVLSLQLQKSPTPNFAGSAEILPTYQRVFLNRECASSNPPRSASQSLNQRLVAR